MGNILIQKPIQDIIKQMALEYNISDKAIQDAVTSQFEYVRDEIKKGTVDDVTSYKTIILKYLGTFSFLEKKHKAIGYKLEKLRDEKPC
jgi:nucleoid DNA-binding protein